MAAAAGLGVLLGLINTLRLATYLSNNKNNLQNGIKKYEAEVKKHTQYFLQYTSKLTDKFYVEMLNETAKEAKILYEQLYELAHTTATCTIHIYQETRKSHF